MPRRALPLLALTLTASLGLSACGLANGGKSAGGDPNAPLTIMADAEPHSTLLKEAEKQGLLGDVKIEVKEIAGDVDPNQLVASGDVDANYFQHKPYLKNWNAEHSGNLQLVDVVHIEPLGLYSRKVSSVDKTPAGANIAIPADAVNQARALFLLEQAGLLTLDVKADDANLDYAQVTEKNITANPKKITFTKVDRPQLAATLDDPKVNLSVVNGNYALEAGLVPDKDALVLDKVENNPYANGLVTRPELANDPRVVKVAQALSDPKIAAFITEHYRGSVLPAKASGSVSSSPTPTSAG
ncbi:MetQ/NlpA family ABC transporter substrate-binding protein [Mobilicoccus massiliensis]|uniref:MetQ/NlpA family ABC transporter substrate-binding protein n=1 Tax=Mobilicoccus massiliensis TaxID=1522310 RepID=UPI000693C0DE|nr:MetQ/NlpA family ABC transporter substrate-binding protein [Mobilicoccus massiliensis]